MQRRIQDRKAAVEDRLPSDLHPVLRRIFLNRGIASAEQLDLSLNSLLPYHSFKGIQTAVELLDDMIQAQKPITIVGDFDADGATSTVVAVKALSRMGAQQVNYLVPDRFRYGYGLTPEIVAVALQREPGLLITVDNGISSIAGVAAAQAAGVKVLITDHHLPGRDLPAADAIVNPNQPGCAFPAKTLAGVGVIFYLMAALRAHLRGYDRLPDPDWSMAELLDLVALGTVADVVPLEYNNRILVHQGLQRIRNGRSRPGIEALIQVARRDRSRLVAADLGFALAPRLNAAGRLQDMSLGIECLLADNPERARALASELDQINNERREIQHDMQQAALAAVERQRVVDSMASGLCVYDAGWHEGVVGLVASHLKEKHHRPCIAFAPSAERGLLKGSARSIPGLHIRDALERVAGLHPGLIDKFGGHAMAAGLSLAEDRLSEFRQAFIGVLDEWLEPSLLQPVIDCDGALSGADINLSLAELLEQASPWGQGFPEPRFQGEFEVLEARLLQERHLKLRLALTDMPQPVDAIAFNALSADDALPAGPLQLVYRLNVNEYRGQRRPQLLIEEIFSAKQ